MSLNKILTLTTRRSVQHLKQPSTRAFSVWGGVEQGPADPILGLTQDFNNDTDCFYFSPFFQQPHGQGNFITFNSMSSRGGSPS